MAGRGALGHVVMVADPIEETFPFTGHTEFRDVDSSARLRVGGRAWVASQARRQLGGFQTETSGGQGLGSDGQAAGAEERGRR